MRAIFEKFFLEAFENSTKDLLYAALCDFGSFWVQESQDLKHEVLFVVRTSFADSAIHRRYLAGMLGNSVGKVDISGAFKE